MKYVLKYLSRGSENNDWSVLMVDSVAEARLKKAFLLSRNYEVRVYCAKLVEVKL